MERERERERERYTSCITLHSEDPEPGAAELRGALVAVDLGNNNNSK